MFTRAQWKQLGQTRTQKAHSEQSSENYFTARTVSPGTGRSEVCWSLLPWKYS